jgi:uncharacterized protein (DUF433 family)
MPQLMQPRSESDVKSDGCQNAGRGPAGLELDHRLGRAPRVLAGRATLRGLRISVAHVVNFVANGMTPAQIVAEYPDLEEEDVREALAYAAAIAQDQIFPIPAGK